MMKGILKEGKLPIAVGVFLIHEISFFLIKITNWMGG